MLYKDLSIFFSLIKPASAYDNSFHYIAVMDEWMAGRKDVQIDRQLKYTHTHRGT